MSIFGVPYPVHQSTIAALQEAHKLGLESQRTLIASLEAKVAEKTEENLALRVQAEDMLKDLQMAKALLNAPQPATAVPKSDSPPPIQRKPSFANSSTANGHARRPTPPEKTAA